MLDIKELDKSLKLRAWGRFGGTKHPFFIKVKGQPWRSNLVSIKLPSEADGVLRRAAELVIIEREKLMSWPMHGCSSNVNIISAVNELKVTDILTESGKMSIQYLAIRRRNQAINARQLTEQELTSLRRHLVWNGLAPLITYLNNQRVTDRVLNDITYMIPTADHRVMNLVNVGSKFIRESIKSETLEPPKLIPDATDGEIKSWARTLKKLTSTRHKSMLLRVAHGDIYSNDRLCRFGLREDSKCENCDEQIETIVHKFAICEKISEVWNSLNVFLNEIDEDPIEFSLKSVIGLRDRPGTLALPLKAEILSRINSRAGKTYDPKAIIKLAMHTILTCEPSQQVNREKIEIFISNL